MKNQSRETVAASSQEENSQGTKQKVAAACTACGSVYAAERWSDGKILPIGHREGCGCGSTTFETVG